MYKSIRVISSSLTKKEKDDLFSLMNDERYLSLIKLHDRLKSNWLQSIHLDRVKPEMKEMYKGGVQMLELCEKAVIDEYRKKKDFLYEKQQTEKILDGLGY